MNVNGVSILVGWTDRLWRVCGNDEERQWQCWNQQENNEEHSQL